MPDSISRLVVRLSGQRIGSLTRLAGERHFFAFDDAYLDNPGRQTLSLSFKSQTGGIVTAVRPYGIRVPPFFSNLLPEGYLRDYLAALSGVKPEREFYLLAALGHDLPGAVTVHEEGNDPDEDGQSVPHELASDSSQAMRFSLAGVQLKFSAIMQAAGRLTIPASGMGGNWIVKLPSARFTAVPENEFVMMQLASRIGIDVPAIELVPVESIGGLPGEAQSVAGNALVVKRFDRADDGRRIHMEDFAQVFGVFAADKYDKRSYANIASVLAAEIGQVAATEFMRRLTFSVLIGNADMHLKNWSLLYPDGIKPALAPAYDYVCTLPYLPNQQLALGFGRSRSMHEITAEQVRRFAQTARLPVATLWKTVLDTTEQTLQAWSSHPERSHLPGPIDKTLDDHLRAVAARIAAKRTDLPEKYKN